MPSICRALTSVQSIQPCQDERSRYYREIAEGGKAEGESAQLFLDDMLKAHYCRKQNISIGRGDFVYIVARVEVVCEDGQPRGQMSDVSRLSVFLARFGGVDGTPTAVRTAKWRILSLL